MDIHKQAIEKKNNRQVDLKNKPLEQKQWEVLRWSNICLHKLPFIMDLTDIKSLIVFKFNQWTDDFCHFNDAKCRWNISSIIRAVRINANFLKSCRLLLYLEICIVQEFLARIKHWVDFIIL